MTNHYCPKARKEGLLVTKVHDETIVYDTTKRKALCLNRITTAVWEACDGNSTLENVLDTIRQASFADANHQTVLMVLDQLEQEGLLQSEQSPVPLSLVDPVTRRGVLEKMGIMMSLPMISSISVSPAIAQVSEVCGGTTGCYQLITCHPPTNKHCWSPSQGCYCKNSSEWCLKTGGIPC